jgi:peptidoglycan/LPS O-acetylase OafA/YrhL
MAIDPCLYGPGWGRAPIHDFSGHVLSALFLGASWTLSAQPGFNLPFWSLNCEAWCYVLFGAAASLHGRQRILALIAGALLAGPKILLYFLCG